MAYKISLYGCLDTDTGTTAAPETMTQTARTISEHPETLETFKHSGKCGEITACLKRLLHIRPAGQGEGAVPGFPNDDFRLALGALSDQIAKANGFVFVMQPLTAVACTRRRGCMYVSLCHLFLKI